MSNQNKYSMKRLLEDYIEDIDIEDVANDEVSSEQDKSEITYDFRLVISIVNDEGVDKASKAAHRILEKYSEIASYNTSVFKSDKPEQNNMYN